MLDPGLLDSRLNALAASGPLAAAVKDYARPEFARGVAYHVDYVGRLGMSGDRVLDAGCGVGNWSIALASYFRKVTALEFNPDRLACTRMVAEASHVDIDAVQGSIEDLPFADGFFDGVFCNGVIFLTDWRKSLSELDRVLKPGGTVYVSFDGLGWWDHLILDRGADDPGMLPMACGMLLNQAADLMDTLCPPGTPDTARFSLLADLVTASLGRSSEQPLHAVRAGARRHRPLRALLTLRGVLLQALRMAPRLLIGKGHAARTTDRGEHEKALAAACDRVFRFGTPDQQASLARDLATVAAGGRPRLTGRRGYCITRRMMRDAAEGLGWEVAGLDNEGVLRVDHSRPLREPIYAAQVDVLEVLARKPCPSAVAGRR